MSNIGQLPDRCVCMLDFYCIVRTCGGKARAGIASFYLVEEYRIPVVSQWRWSQINARMMEEQSSVVIITDYNIIIYSFLCFGTILSC